MSPAPSRGLRTLAVLALLAFGTSGCGGEEEAGSGTDAAPTAEPAPDGTDGTGGTDEQSDGQDDDQDDEGAGAEAADLDEPERPDDGLAAGARKDYVEFVVASWNYALATNDARPVDSLWLPRKGTCVGCAELAQELDQRREEGWKVDLGEVEVRKVALSPGGGPRTLLATAKVDIPASTSYFDDGSVRNESAAHDGAAFEVRASWTGKRWSLDAFGVS